MTRDKLIKINGKEVKDIKESVRLFNILEAGKNYKLNILPTGRFKFEETKDKSRLCKVINKKLLKKNTVQLNLHDGTNVLSGKDSKVKVGDSVLLGEDNKVKKVISLEKGKDVFVISGGSIGMSGKIQSIEKNKAKIKLDDIDKEVELDISHIVVR